MSCVFVNLGQCGNQLGQIFWQELDQWHKRSQLGAAAAGKDGKARFPYATLDGSLPCVLVDTERKVVTRCAGVEPLKRRLAPDCVFTECRGRGNNWAYGYYRSNVSSRSGDLRALSVESIAEQVRRMAEKVDCYNGTVLLHSTAGGTGSGLGSALLEHLRDQYPAHFLLSIAVSPFASGETPLQHYNSLFCLSWLQQYADAVLLFQNDLVLKSISKSAAKPSDPLGTNTSVSMEDMNRHIVSILCNSFLPLWSAERKRNTCFSEPWELVRSLCSNPAFKYITPAHTESASTWEHLFATPGHRTSMASSRHALSLAVIARGNHVSMKHFCDLISSTERRLKQAYRTVEWNPFPVDFYLSQEPHLQNHKMLTVLANSAHVLDHIEVVLQRAEAMYRAGAYLHWYERYGCRKETFGEAFETLRDVVGEYSRLK